MILFAALTAIGCQHDPYADWFVKKDVPESSLLGTYHVTQETLEYFANHDMRFIPGGRLPVKRETRIELAPSHKILLQQMPIDLGEAPFCILSGRGTWKVDKHQDYSAVFVTLSTRQPSANGCPKGEFALVLELFDDSMLRRHSSTKYPLLHLTIGDPDSGNALQFEKD